MPGQSRTLETLMLETLKDIYHAEKQILRALPKMAKAASSDELRNGLEQHRKETEGQIERLEKVFEALDKTPRSKTCEAMQGLIAEGQDIMEDFSNSDALDAGLVAASQAIEHYEISRYGTLRTWAQQLGMDEAAKLFEQNLEEEKRTAAMLTKMAEAEVNRQAA